MSTFYDGNAPRRARSGLDGGAAAADRHAQAASPAFASILAGVDHRHHQPRGAGAAAVTRKYGCWSGSRQAARPMCLAASAR